MRKLQPREVTRPTPEDTRDRVGPLQRQYIFGPVPSRRLGRSLGIDLVPLKTCPYDCVYCQLGRTTRKTSQRAAWMPIDQVLAQLDQRLVCRPDYVTLGGSGEPTLCRGLDRLIEGIHARTDVPVAILTNGSLLWRKEVRQELVAADLVIPSLDAGDQATFERVNRPCPTIAFEAMVEGLIDFRREFSGDYWLEVFALNPDIQDEATWPKIVRWISRIQPDRVQLNTVTRPPCEAFAESVPASRLARLASAFTPPAEVIADVHGVHDLPEFRASEADVLALLRRRPCSLDDLATGLNTHRNEIVKHIESLAERGVLRETLVQGRRFYFATTGEPTPDQRPTQAPQGPGRRGSYSP